MLESPAPYQGCQHRKQCHYKDSVCCQLPIHFPNHLLHRQNHRFNRNGKLLSCRINKYALQRTLAPKRGCVSNYFPWARGEHSQRSVFFYTIGNEISYGIKKAWPHSHASFPDKTIFNTRKNFLSWKSEQGSLLSFLLMILSRCKAKKPPAAGRWQMDRLLAYHWNTNLSAQYLVCVFLHYIYNRHAKLLLTFIFYLYLNENRKHCQPLK